MAERIIIIIIIIVNKTNVIIKLERIVPGMDDVI